MEVDAHPRSWRGIDRAACGPSAQDVALRAAEVPRGPGLVLLRKPSMPAWKYRFVHCRHAPMTCKRLKDLDKP